MGARWLVPHLGFGRAANRCLHLDSGARGARKLHTCTRARTRSRLGPPAARSHELVVWDLLEGKVSPPAAEAAYGIVAEPAELAALSTRRRPPAGSIGRRR